jgi:hypothetical protein
MQPGEGKSVWELVHRMIGERTSWETLRSHLSTHQVVTVRLPTTEDADVAQAALDVGGLGYVVKARLASDLLPAIRAGARRLPLYLAHAAPR